MQTFKNKLQTAQNKMIRFVFDLGSRSHVGYDCFEKLKWMSVQRRIDYFKLCFHKIHIEHRNIIRHPLHTCCNNIQDNMNACCKNIQDNMHA